MQILFTFLAFAGLASFAIAVSPVVERNCGRCDTFPSGEMGGNAQIPLRTSAASADGKAYKCTTFGKEVRLSTCINRICGVCMIFRDDNCQGDILHWGGPGSQFGGQGAHSYFCM